MKKYMDPEMEIVEIDEKDIIFASGETTTGDEPEETPETTPTPSPAPTPERCGEGTPGT